LENGSQSLQTAATKVSRRADRKMSIFTFDAHKLTSTIAYHDPAGEAVVSERIYTRKAEVAKLLHRFAKPWVVYMEACRQAPALCRWLWDLGAEVHLLNPQKLKALAKLDGAKTDGKDARFMLRLVDVGFAPEAYLAPPEVVEDRALSRGHDVLRKTATTYRNQLRTVFAQHDVQCDCSDLRSRKARERMWDLIDQLPQNAAMLAGLYWTLLEQVENALSAVDAQISSRGKADPVVCELMKIHGIGILTAFGIVAEVGDVERFINPKHFVGYAGLGPVSNDSDGYKGKRKLPKRCNKRLRYLAVMAAQCASRCKKPSRAREAYLRVKVRCGANTGKIAAARELLADVFYAWRRLNVSRVQAA